MTPAQQRRLGYLFAASSQDTLTDLEHAELESLLRSDHQARQFWFLHQDVELGLKRLLLVQSLELLPPQRDEGASLHEGLNLVRSQQDTKTSRLRPRHVTVVRRRSAVALAVVACLCVLFISQICNPGFRRFAFQNERNRETRVAAIEGISLRSPTHGTSFTLNENHGKKIALHFLLKSECPFCLKLTHDYAMLAESTPEVVHLFLKPDGDDEIKSWASKIHTEKLQSAPVIYRDTDARLAEIYRIPGGYQFHGQTMHYPALILLDESGDEVFRYVGKDNTDRLATDQFVTQLAHVFQRKSSVSQAN